MIAHELTLRFCASMIQQRLKYALLFLSIECEVSAQECPFSLPNSFSPFFAGSITKSKRQKQKLPLQNWHTKAYLLVRTFDTCPGGSPLFRSGEMMDATELARA